MQTEVSVGDAGLVPVRHSRGALASDDVICTQREQSSLRGTRQSALIKSGREWISPVADGTIRHWAPVRGLEIRWLDSGWSERSRCVCVCISNNKNSTHMHKQTHTRGREGGYMARDKMIMTYKTIYFWSNSCHPCRTVRFFCFPPSKAGALYAKYVELQSQTCRWLTRELMIKSWKRFRKIAAHFQKLG